jgi:type II secretory pathway component PulL
VTVVEPEEVILLAILRNTVATGKMDNLKITRKKIKVMVMKGKFRIKLKLLIIMIIMYWSRYNFQLCGIWRDTHRVKQNSPTRYLWLIYCQKGKLKTLTTSFRNARHRQMG